MNNSENEQVCLEVCIGTLLRYIDEFYEDFVGGNILADELYDFECEKIELSDADCYGSEEYDYYKKSEAKSEMRDQIESIIEDAYEAYKGAAEEHVDCVYEIIEKLNDRINFVLDVDGIKNICELCVDNVIENDESLEEVASYCVEKLENVFSVIQNNEKKMQESLAQFDCQLVIGDYFSDKIGSVDDYVKLCDIEEDEEDDDTVYAYVLDDALEQIQEDVNDMLEELVSEIANEFDVHLKEQFDKLRLDIKNVLKDYLDSEGVINSYNEGDGEFYYSTNNVDDESGSDLYSNKKSTFRERLESEIVGTAWFLSSFFDF